MKKNNKKIALIAILVVIIILILIVGIAFIMLAVNTNQINDDYTVAINSEKYQAPVFVDGIELIKQDVSCGYAVNVQIPYQ